MGVAVAAALKNSGHDVCWASENRSPDTRRRAASAGLTDAGTVAAICRHCEAIVSVCPPEFAEAMAREIAGHGFQGLYIDANAISPEKASRIARMMEAGGVRFVDGSIIGLPARAARPGSTFQAGTRTKRRPTFREGRWKSKYSKARSERPRL
jgi:3-hydroxyisobutyrate dehydrogenase-like beta-hydroxyacid dehydrogenase